MNLTVWQGCLLCWLMCLAWCLVLVYFNWFDKFVGSKQMPCKLCVRFSVHFCQDVMKTLSDHVQVYAYCCEVMFNFVTLSALLLSVKIKLI